MLAECLELTDSRRQLAESAAHDSQQVRTTMVQQARLLQ